MKLNQGPISENSLMEKLVTAKKFMMVMGDTNSNTMVNENTHTNNNYKPSTYTPPTYNVYDEDEISDDEYYNNDSEVSPITANHEKIMQTKLPDSIKKVMIENPIAQISLNDTIDMSFTEGAKKLMERSGLINKKPESKQPAQNLNNRDIIKTLTPIIEKIIEKSLDKLLEAKIDKMLKAQESININENLVLKVGTSIFKGKITEVKKTT